MMADGEECSDEPMLATLTSLARESMPSATSAQLGRGWATVSSRLASRDVRRRLFLRVSWAGAAACGVTLLALGIVSWSRAHLHSAAPPALVYRIEGGSVLDGGYLRESGSEGVRIRFAEGTEFALAPGARGRLRSVDSAGARIAIETGSASVQVTPRSEAKWLIDAGPFLVTVKGTVFNLSWDPAAEKFELTMQHGQVLVTGPVSQDGIALRAGQRLAVNLPKKETLITELKKEEAWPGAAPAAPTVDLPTERPAAPEAAAVFAPPPPAGGKGSERRRWAEALAAGDWDQILADVDRMGAKRILAEASNEELSVVADAARYRRRVVLAREALLAERRRFPGSARALDAAFQLGRLEELNERGTARALAWYEEYLRQAPTGTYAAEALGRKMMATSKLQGASRAQPIAEQYLRRFPSGTYAGAARALLNGP
jgi:hypothetical protein